MNIQATQMQNIASAANTDLHGGPIKLFKLQNGPTRAKKTLVWLIYMLI